MKIKGIAGKKSVGHRKGDPIPLSPEEKAFSIAADIVINNSDDVWKNIPVEQELLGNVQVIRGRKGVKNPEPDQYKALVKVTYKRLDMIRDKLFGAKSVTVRVLFEDCKDDLGLPDLQVIKQEFL